MRVAERAEESLLVVARVLEQGERLVGVRGDDDPVEAMALAVVGRQLDTVRVTPERMRTEAEPQPRAERSGDRPDVGVGAAAHRPPGEAPEPEHAVVVEEADRVRRRELERAPGRVDQSAEVSGTMK